MIKTDMLDAFSDEDVREVRTLAEKVLKRRDDERKEKAMEQARATLAAVGLTFKDLTGIKAKAPKGPSYRGGLVYQHPNNKALVWHAKGQKPKWLRELEGEGGAAREVVNG
jgi:hypothetical protein